jgi:hypothetical protein
VATTVSELFRAHGIELDERQALDLIDAALLGTPSAAPMPSPLAPTEAGIYDQAGMPEDGEALRQQVTDVATRSIALLATAIPVADAAARIGVSRSRMQQMISARHVWAVRQRTRWVLPAVQFDGEGLLPGWATVARALPESAHPLEILGFMTTPQPELELRGQPQSVRDWLRSGGSPLAVEPLTAGLRNLAA